MLNALGCATDADEMAVKRVILRLQAPGAGLMAVRARLGLDEDATEAVMLNAIDGLKGTHRKGEAEALVDGAMEAGKIRPAHKEFWLNAATVDFQTAKAEIDSMQVLTEQGGDRVHSDPQKSALTEEAKKVCHMLGLSEEQFQKARG